MPAEARTWVNVEGALRSWARAAVPAFSGRVFFGLNNDAPLPQVVLLQIAGPDDRAWIQWDVWASKAQAITAANALMNALDALSYYSVDGVLLKGARIDNKRWLIDVESNTSRYVIDTTVTAMAA